METVFVCFTGKRVIKLDRYANFKNSVILWEAFVSLLLSLSSSQSS
jgi:hypothetical protein